MKNVSNPQARKQGGFIMTTELILLVTVMVIGMIVGLVTLRDATTAEMEDVAEAIGSLDQSYAFSGLLNAETTATVEGSDFIDAVDTAAGDEAVFTFVNSDGTEAGTINQGGTALAADAGAASAAAPGTITNP